MSHRTHLVALTVVASDASGCVGAIDRAGLAEEVRRGGAGSPPRGSTSR